MSRARAPRHVASLLAIRIRIASRHPLIQLNSQGPDALLDPAGVGQAEAVNAGWKQQIQAGVPLPETLYSSPMRRSAYTLNITWGDILLNKGYVPYVSLPHKLDYRRRIG